MKRYVRSARSSTAYTPRGGSKSNQYDQYQEGEIRKGLESGVDTSTYADPRYGAWQMEEIRKGLESGVDVSVYADPKYNSWQMREIREGLESGVDVDMYADPKYDEYRMQAIREGLESGVDVSIYADLIYVGSQMDQIREGLESGVDVTIYADPKFDEYQMREIRRGLESGVDVSIYADPSYHWGQMAQIREGLESGVDATIYADPRYTPQQMYDTRIGLKKYANDPDIDTASVEQILEARRKNAPSLAWVSMSRNDRAKDSWSKVKNAAASRQPLDIPAIEEEFNLMTLEGAAANKLGLSFEENADGTITFFDNTGAEVRTIDAATYDGLVKSAIAASSTRSSFTKAFMSRLKRALFL